jgi:putative acetyltransferase
VAGTGSEVALVIRERRPSDDDAIKRVVDQAFGRDAESGLVEALRGSDLAAVELVATEENEIVGHMLMSALSVFVDDEPVPSLALAPLSVRPDLQGTGIGTALIDVGLDVARVREWQAVLVLGDPEYYPRFGFSAEAASHLDAPYSGEAFMALELVEGALDGEDGLVVYPAPFTRVD